MSLLSLNSAVPSVRRPAFDIELASSAASVPGGMLSSAVSSALDGAGGDPWQQSLVALVVDVGLAPSADMVELRLAVNDQLPGISVGEAASFSLGYEDSGTETVFTGEVQSIRRAVGGVLRVMVANGGTSLCSLRVNQSYEKQTAGDIVNDLAGRAGVSTRKVEDGVDFPFYVVDDRRSAYGHIALLARKSGYVALMTTDGELDFLPLTIGDPVRKYAYGTDILSLQTAESGPGIGSATIVGDGAAGSQGQDAWHWLVKDPSAVTARSGGSPPERLVSDHSLRSTDAVQNAADGVVGASDMLGVVGYLIAPGSPGVTVGSTIEITGAPDDALNGSCLVHAVRHRYSKQAGFTTRMLFSKPGSGPMGVLGAAGGLL